jgi:hypothetical protein
MPDAGWPGKRGGVDLDAPLAYLFRAPGLP